MTTEIIIDLRPLEGQKSAKATGNVTVATDRSDITILGVKVIHQDGKAPWVAFPQIEFPSKDGKERRHKDVVTLSHRLAETIKDEILAKYLELSGNAAPF